MYIYHVYILSHFPITILIEDEKLQEFLYFHKNDEIIKFKVNNLNHVILSVIHIVFRKILSMDEIILILKDCHKTSFFNW